MLNILCFSFLYHKLQLCFICYVHYTSFICDKTFLKFSNFKRCFEFIFNCDLFLSVCDKLLSSKNFINFFFYNPLQN
jgi:hypothetical protein